MTRLNLGAGDDRRDGYVSVDVRPEVADVVCDVRKLERWADNSVEEILALDILEHFPYFQTGEILDEWHRVLRPGGRLEVRVPNAYQLCRGIVERYEAGVDVPIPVLINNLMGGHKFGFEGCYDAHHWNFTPRMLHEALRDAGFDVLADDGQLNNTVIARKR